MNRTILIAIVGVIVYAMSASAALAGIIVSASHTSSARASATQPSQSTARTPAQALGAVEFRDAGFQHNPTTSGPSSLGASSSAGATAVLTSHFAIHAQTTVAAIVEQASDSPPSPAASGPLRPPRNLASSFWLINSRYDYP